MAETQQKKKRQRDLGYSEKIDENLLNLRNEILKLESNIKHKETLEMNQVVIFHKYVLDIFRSDKTAKGVTYYSCQKTERNKKQNLQRQDKKSSFSNRDTKDVKMTCSGKLHINSTNGTIQVTGHSCNKEFSSSPPIVKDFVQNSLLKLDQSQAPNDVLQTMVEKHFEGTGLITHPLKLRKLISNQFTSFKKQWWASGGFDGAEIKLKTMEEEISNVGVLCHPNQSKYSGRKLLVWIYHSGLNFLKLLLEKEYPILMSLDTTHDAVNKKESKQTYLATLMF